MKYFSIDRVFRNESLDATHLAEFHQVEVNQRPALPCPALPCPALPCPAPALRPLPITLVLILVDFFSGS